VTFAMRGGQGSLVALLRGALPEGLDDERGGDHATGASLDPEVFERTMDALGVAQTAHI